jgi:hypothetical protein
MSLASFPLFHLKIFPFYRKLFWSGPDRSFGGFSPDRLFFLVLPHAHTAIHRSMKDLE